MNNKENIVREAASQRRHYRLSAPLRVSLDGQEYTIHNWSIGGIAIHDYDGTAALFDELDAQVSVAFGDYKINFNTRIRVSRYDADKREIAAAFFSLNEKHQELLKYFSDSLIQGEMASINDTIKRIDIPVTPVSEKPDLLPNHSISLRRRSVKTLAISGAYLLLGIFLTYYTISTVYTNIFKLRVDTATITGPNIVLKAPASGVIDKIYVNIGDPVSSNDPLFYIRNEDTLEEIEMAKIEIRNTQIDLKEKKQHLESQQKELRSYRKFGIHKLQIAEARTTELQEMLHLAQKRQKRIARLHDDGSVSEEDLEKVTEQLLGLRAELEVATAEQKIADWAIKETYNGYYYTDEILIGKVDELQTAIMAAQERVALKEERLNILESRQERLFVNAPVDGKILSHDLNIHQIIEKGEPLLLIEQHDGKRGVEAFISAQEMENVTVNQPATVIINRKVSPLNARVTSIERTRSVDDDMLGFVRVMLTFSKNVAQETIAALPSGFPVTVVFSKGTFFRQTSTANEKQEGS
ncbi:MAG: HlyD family efflux transporter periplasmic adaptor subunit [Gammaproteobacteria bacterium]|nr:HlyD family efflux transporter periplasmic adaptor subunit [Gammaproteobacteria bacterium]